MQTNAVASVAVAAFLITAALGSAEAQRPAPAPSKFQLMTPAFSDGGTIPTPYSCSDPKGGSPPLQWSNPPAGTMSFALIVHDTEGAPAKSSMDVTHWIVWNLPANTTSLPADVMPGTSLDGMVQGPNVRKVNGFQPPCPPPGAVAHHYLFEIYALDAKLDLAPDSSRADLLKAMDGHVLGKSAYVGMFGR